MQSSTSSRADIAVDRAHNENNSVEDFNCRSRGA